MKSFLYLEILVIQPFNQLSCLNVYFSFSFSLQLFNLTKSICASKSKLYFGYIAKIQPCFIALLEFQFKQSNQSLLPKNILDYNLFVKQGNATMVHLVVCSTTRCLWSQYYCTQLRLLYVLSCLLYSNIVLSQLSSHSHQELHSSDSVYHTCILPCCKVWLKRTQCPRVSEKASISP